MKFWLATLALVAFFGTKGTAAPKPPVLPPPPPMTQGETVSTYLGQSVEVPLKALGRATSPLKFLIRIPPKHGKLGEIRITGNKTAVVTYTHDEKEGLAADSFTFAVQGIEGPVSASGLITIIVSEEPPSFAAVPALDFSKIWLGETAEQQFILQNAGGGVLAGKVTVLAPWKILGNADYSLSRKQETVIHVQFAPKEAGDFRDKLTFSHDFKVSVDLSGSADAPLELTPARKIELSVEGSEKARVGKLLVRNVTAKDRPVKISAPPEIVAPDEVVVPAGGEKEIPLRTTDQFLTELDGALTVESEGFNQELELHVFALPPRLEFAPAAGISLGEIQSDRHYKSSLTLKNTGGDSAHLRATMPQGVMILPDPNSEVLKVGETRVFEIAFESGNPGSYQKTIEIGAEGGSSISVPITAKISAPQPAIVTAPTLTPKEAPPMPEPAGANIAYNGTPMVSDIKTLKSGKYEVEIGWKKPGPNVSSYLIEVRSLKPAAGGAPKITWTEWHDVKYLEENGLFVARLERLHAGQALFFRVSSIDGAGKPSQPSETIRLYSPAPFHIDWFLILTILLVVGAIANYFLRTRQQRRIQTMQDAARLAKIEGE